MAKWNSHSFFVY